MTETFSWILIGMSILLGSISILTELNHHKIITKNKVLKHLHNSFDFTIGIYAIAYALFIITTNVLGLQIKFPQDDVTLTTALFYGGLHIMYPYFSHFLRIISLQQSI